MMQSAAGHHVHKNLVKRNNSLGVFVAQWFEHPSGVSEVVGFDSFLKL